ncbi:hypothetical protein WMY93_026338 [Mugilogobius chulae]|uniref:Uncharacterized protein n=1 Tax=Mugilogobius chulae TaxID=88201 RepID=A0AAW0N3X5_9GOBI
MQRETGFEEEEDGGGDLELKWTLAQRMRKMWNGPYYNSSAQLHSGSQSGAAYSGISTLLSPTHSLLVQLGQHLGKRVGSLL